MYVHVETALYVEKTCLCKLNIWSLPMSISTTRQQINPWWVYYCPYLANPLLFCKGQLKPGRLSIYRILWYHILSYILLYLIHLIFIFSVSFLYCNLILSLFIDSNLVYLISFIKKYIHVLIYRSTNLSIYQPTLLHPGELQCRPWKPWCRFRSLAQGLSLLDSRDVPTN